MGGPRLVVLGRIRVDRANRLSIAQPTPHLFATFNREPSRCPPLRDPSTIHR
jgi:hypothetical protein